LEHGRLNPFVFRFLYHQVSSFHYQVSQ
jgi:hypothetical protein